MRKFSPTPQNVYKEYRAGLDFNNNIELYRNVETNENFFIGKQWEGVKSNGLPTPVFNFLKRVVLFSVANVSTDNLKLHAENMPSTGERDPHTMEVLTDIINDQFANIFEMNSIGSCVREFARNAAVDADGCTYTYFDPDTDIGQTARGDIRTEVLQNTQVTFGNPNSRDVQSQPFIIIDRRMLVDEAIDRAIANDISEEDAESLILPDDKENLSDSNLDRLGGGKVTVLLRLWRDKKTGNIHGYECTRDCVVREEWDLGIKLYPVTWMNWDYVQDCYHGQAMITGLIPNQIFVNKLFAMSMISLMTLAYPKVVFDKTRINKWDNRVGAAIGVNGSVENVSKIVDPATISPQIAQFIDLAVSYTQKFLGASDVAMGDTRPDNTSAIIALQRAAATPMELTKQNLLKSVEDLGRIYMEFMGEYYGSRFVQIPNPYDTDKLVVPFDFTILKKLPFQIKLDVGNSSYWSEIASQQTLDNLLMQGKISTVDYLKRLPAGSITDREALIKAMQQPQTLSQDGASGEGAPSGGESVPLVGGRGNHELQRKINQTGEVPPVM
ncbi:MULTISPECIES: hypothetical protein [unclassified Oscillibacter]|uniref:portal protein n=1 Tax=unclassified Oscillibacter TaxID=2629304 RepID=UPI0025DCFE63|nr:MULTISPECIES: hypothetical protein [unclassified Oscillibacter]